MRINATHLSQWSDGREAEGLLPVLIRKLILSISSVTEISMPGEDSVNAPGWDGVVEVPQGNSWVPGGKSYWELSTSKDPTSKTNRDFEKRQKQISAEAAAQATFVLATSRRWPGKDAWKEKARKRNFWADVRAWDADDLVTWLDISSPIRAWFGAQIGICGEGIESVKSYWENWSNQPKPEITKEVLFNGREESKRALQKSIQERNTIIAVKADSQAEAAAFTCASLIEQGYDLRSVCINSEKGWQFLEANPDVEVVVVTDSKLSQQQAPRPGVSLIIPMAIGEHTPNLVNTGKHAPENKIIALHRPKPHEFEKSLRELGIPASDSLQRIQHLGRSWTVFRRLYATNPAIRKPDWIKDADTTSLLILILANAWDGSFEGDRAFVSEVANKPYENIDAELSRLAELDDAPVVKIADVWKAKAPLDLLYRMSNRFADKLAADIFLRFFQAANAVFTEPEPALELAESNYRSGHVDEKDHQKSGILLDEIAKSMAKLGAFCDSKKHPVLDHYVRNFVEGLLKDASEERWLSISFYLRSFAEAAPDEFLNAVEESLQKPDKPILCLITERMSRGNRGKWWHLHLLWGLELLAWDPKYFERIANILVELSNVKIKENIANTPFNTLVSLFQIGHPQTGASVEIRLRVIRSIVERHPETGWSFLLKLIPKASGFSLSNAKPRWRDAGNSKMPSSDEFKQFISLVSDLLIENAQKNPHRISLLIPKIDELNTSFRDKVISLVKGSIKLPDEDREVIRNAIREFLFWENSRNKVDAQHNRYSADALRPLYDSLAADDLVIRNLWLFSNNSKFLPDKSYNDSIDISKKRDLLCASAVREIYQTLGWPGIDRLAKSCECPQFVGHELAKELFHREDLSTWLCQWYLNLSQGSILDPLTNGVLTEMPKEKQIGFLKNCLQELEQNSASFEEIVNFITNASQNISLWKFVEEQPKEIIDSFWSTVQFFNPPPSSGKDLFSCVEKLLNVRRPKTALNAILDRASELPAELLKRMLKNIAAGQEKDADILYHWFIPGVFKVLRDAGCSQSEMARIEFFFYSELENSEYGTPHLMAEILTQPEFFMDIICLDKNPDKIKDNFFSDNFLSATQTANALLQRARGLPGKNASGEIERESFFLWVNKVRDLANERNLKDITDYQIGRLFSNWPMTQSLNSWPNPMVADLLDQLDSTEIRRGFHYGVYCSRGVTSRAIYDGGTQEQHIADEFRRFSTFWKNSKPHLAAMLEELAQEYEGAAKRADDRGLLRQEL